MRNLSLAMRRRHKCRLILARRQPHTALQHAAVEPPEARRIRRARRPAKSYTGTLVKNQVNMLPTRFVMSGTPSSLAIAATPSAMADVVCSSRG